MKVKVIELAHTSGDYDDEHEHYGIDQGGVYEVVDTFHEVEAIAVVNKHGRKVMLYNDEIKVYEEE